MLRTSQPTARPTRCRVDTSAKLRPAKATKFKKKASAKASGSSASSSAAAAGGTSKKPAASKKKDGSPSDDKAKGKAKAKVAKPFLVKKVRCQT